MAYILRTHVKSKYVFQALQSVYGIGSYFSYRICQSLGFQKLYKSRLLTDEHLFYITQCVDDFKLPIKGDLKRWCDSKVDRLMSLKAFRGVRHRQGLPVRGQRTHTNARTKKKFKILNVFKA